MTTANKRTVAHLIAEYLQAQHVIRVYGLCGGHIQPIWDTIARAGIEIVDVRHEASAVYMAQAEHELTGRLGVALVTAGPGLTNAVTAISNASVSRSSVLVISGRTPRPQTGMGAMQDIPQADIVDSLCRRVEQVSQRHHVLPRLDAVRCAALGDTGQPGPAYIDFPTDLLDETVHPSEVDQLQLSPRHVQPVSPPAETLQAAKKLIIEAQRPLIIGGKAVKDAVPQLVNFIEATDALYLDTSESRGALPASHPSSVPAMRARAMREADLIVTIGRRLDFQLGYGSAAVFESSPAFLRIGRSFEETGENRRGDVEIRADARLILAALLDDKAIPASLDQGWINELRTGNHTRMSTLQQTMAGHPPGGDGRMHPYRVIDTINEHLTDDAIVVADGGDILSFARVGLRAVRYLDCGALGCLGVGVPFGIAAALNNRDVPVIALIGDGSFGFTALDVETAVRRQAPVLFVVANNEAWNIERWDQIDRYGSNTVGVDLPGCRYDRLGQALGAYGERVERPEDLRDAVKRGLENAPAVLDVLVTRDAISPDLKSGLATVPARHALLTWHTAELNRLDATT